MESVGLYLGLLALGVCLAVPIAALAVGLGQGNAAASALQGMARQPEMHGKLQTSMLIALGFMEALAIYALLVFFLMFGKLPSYEQLIDKLPK
jgi:F-type H+-transporting ATPase subunit c